MRFATVVTLGLCGYAAWGAVTTGSLVDEMTDLNRLTRFPSPAFKTVQFSSYDRTSAVPGGKGWFANADGFGGEPVPNFESVIKAAENDAPGEYLICDVNGPGAIVRTWTAQIQGTLRLYLDNGPRPLYDGPAEEFLLHPYNTFLEGSGLTPASLDGAFYQRNAAYAPIPFASRCRMIWIGDPRDTHFYQVQVRVYDKDTAVTSFSADDLVSNAARIRRTAALLTDPDADWPYPSARAPINFIADIAPGVSNEVLALDGPGAIVRFTLKVDAADMDKALRQTVLFIRCDGDPWGQVQSPVGDFFGAGPGISPYHSVPFTVAADGTMTCRYVMPYKESFRVVLQNRSGEDVSVTGSALPADVSWDDRSSMYFRARWRIDHDLNASDSEVAGIQDLPFLIARGTGVYVGTAVMLLNPNTVPASWGNWWGEGDEKIFVDGDIRPSIFGTGSEDYFNYAWSASDIFCFPYCGQPRDDGPANRGNVVNFRWHVLDPIPFNHGISFSMELFAHEPTPGFSYGRIAYHYALPGLTDDSMPLTGEDLRIPRLPETWEPSARFGAAKFTFRACEDAVKSRKHTAFEQGALWQGGRVLVWSPVKTGEKLKLDFTVPESGDYTVMLACMLRPGGGAFRADIDGTPIRFEGKDSVNLAIPANVQSRIMGGQVKQLATGHHALTLTALEAGQSIGLDFVGFQKH